MLPHVLRRLESLRSDLAAIDPAYDADAADRVATLAVALRDVLVATGLTDRAADAADTAGFAVSGG